MFIRIFTVVFLAAVTAVLPAQNIGDLVGTVNFPPDANNGKQYFAFDPALGRYYFSSSDQIWITDRTGQVIKNYDYSESDNATAFRGAFGFAAFVRGGVWYILDNDRITMTTWTIIDNNDGTADPNLTGTVLFDQAIPAACISAIDRAGDGSWWVSCSGNYYHLSPDASAVRDTLTANYISTRVTGKTGELLFEPSLLAVDSISNIIYFAAYRRNQSNRKKFYRYDLQGNVQEGRFSAHDVIDNGPLSRITGDHEEVILYNAITQRIEVYAVPPADLPGVQSYDFEEQGIMWIECFDHNSNSYYADFTIDINQEADGATFANISGVPLSVQNPVSGQIEGTLRKPNLLGLGETTTSVFLLDQLDGQLSLPFEMQIPMGAYDGPVLFDAGCSPYINTTIDTGKKLTTWSWNGVAPQEPFNAYVEFEDFVPWVGGKRYGIKDTQMSGRVELASQGDSPIAVSGGGQFELGSGALRLEFGGGALQELTIDGPELNGAIATFKLAGIVSEEAGITKAFPQLEPLRRAKFFGTAFRWLDERAKLSASISAGIEAATKFKFSEDNDLLIDGEVTGFLAMAVNAAVRLFGGYAEATAYGEGKAAMTFVPSSSGLSFKETTLSFLVGGKIRAYLLERAVQRVFSITFTASRGRMNQLPNDGVISDTGYRYAYNATAERGVPESIVKPYIITPNPIQAFRDQSRAKRRVTGAETFDRELDVIGGIPSGASLNVAIDRRDGQDRMMAVWQQPIAGKRATQATDLYFSYFDGIRFTNPAPINDDDRMDFNPQAFYFKEDFWIVVWERVGIANFQPTGDPEVDNETLIENLVPCWAVFNTKTGTWSEPEQIPIQGMNAFNIQALPDPTGFGGGLAWLESDTGNMLPWDLNADPVSEGRIGGVRLYYAFFELVGYPDYTVELKTPLVLGEQDPDHEIPDDIVEYAMVRHGSFSEVLISRMVDVGSVSPLEANTKLEEWTQQYFVTNSRMRLKAEQNDYSLNSNLKILSHPYYGATFTPFHVATSADPSRHLGPAVFTGGVNSYPAFFEDYEPAEDYDPSDPKYYSGSAYQTYTPYQHYVDDGEYRQAFPYIAYTQNDSNGQPNLFLASQTRNAGPIVRDAGSIEKQVTVSDPISGTLLISYLKTDLNKTPTTVRILGEPAELVAIEETETSTLAMTHHIVATELMPSSVEVIGGVPRPGASIVLKAEITNPGDFELYGPEFSIYAYPLGENRDAELIPIIENEDFSSRIRGNATAARNINWVIPDERDYGFVLITDPLNEIEEYDEDNNMLINEDSIPFPPAVLEWLLGRLNKSDGLDTNSDGVIDSADIE